MQKIKNNNPNSQLTEESQTSTTLSNFNAYELIYKCQDGQCKYKVMEIVTIKNGKDYYTTFTAELTEHYKYLSLTENMINSFEIKENSNLPPTLTN